MGKYKTFGSRFDRVHRNDLNSNFAAVEADINAQKNRVDDLITGTPQPSEVVDARGGETTLGTRLNNLSSSLAQTSTEIDATNLRVDELVIGSGDANVEVSDAHVSTVKNKTFTTVRNRFEHVENDVDLMSFPITNLVANGDFSNGITGWSGTTLGSFTATGDTASFTATAQNGRISTNANMVNGHKFYIGAYIETTSPQVTLSVAGVSPIPHDGTGGKILSNVFTWTNTTNPWTVQIRDVRTSAWDSIKVRYVKVFDLTEVYGAGNEPTKEEMDALLAKLPNSWFDGKISSLYSLKDFFLSNKIVTTEKVADKAITAKKRTASGSSAIVASQNNISFDSITGKITIPWGLLFSGNVIKPLVGGTDILSTIEISIPSYLSNSIYRLYYDIESAPNYPGTYPISSWQVIEWTTAVTNENLVLVGAIAKGQFVYLSETKVASLVAQPGETTGGINNLSGKKLTVIGDSITAGHSLGFTVTWGYKIGLRNNMTVVNKASNGINLAGTSNAYGSSISSRYSTVDIDSNYVTVFGGTNDYNNSIPMGTDTDNTVDTFKGALNVMCSGLITRVPKAKILFLTPFHFNDTPNSLSLTIKDYVDAIIAICSKYGIPVLDNYRNGNLLPMNTTQKSALMMDIFHPTDEGHTFISTKIEAFLNNL
jgi:lysophospholipase L1-like esterase